MMPQFQALKDLALTAAGTKHRPSQLSVDDIDLVSDIRSPHPAMQRTPVPLTPQSASPVSFPASDLLAFLPLRPFFCCSL